MLEIHKMMFVVSFVFRVGPLHGDKEYSVGAKKEGYVLTAIDGKFGKFTAFKLGEVIVQVSDNDDDDRLMMMIIMMMI